MLLSAAGVSAASLAASAQTEATPPGITLGNEAVTFRDPATLRASRAVAWTDEATGDRFVWLRADDTAGPRAATVGLGRTGFDASQVLVRIRATSPGPGSVNQLAVVLADAQSVVLDPVGTTTRPDASAVATAASQLLVTARTTGGVRLQVDALDPADAAPDDAFLADAFARLGRFDATPIQPAAPVADVPLLTDQERARRDEMARQVQQRRDRLTEQALASAGPPSELRDDARAVADRPTPDPGVLPVRGVVSYVPGSLAIDRGDDETVVSLLDGVTMLFEDFSRRRTVTLKAQRAVLFIANDEDDTDNPAGLAGGTIDAGGVQGVYLEDNAIVTDGDYTVRAPRVYYDLTTNRAVLLDAVMFTYDLRRGVPLYLRAEVMRQNAARSFTAEGATFTTSEFAEPHFALGASRITVGQYETADGRVGSSVDASNVTARVSDVPMFWLPRFAGRGTDTPIRNVRVGYSSKDGVQVETEWDAFGLIGREAPEGVDADLNLDYQGEHGPGIGLNVDYDRLEENGMSGEFVGYTLLADHGEDEIARRRDIDQDGDTRGVASWQHRQVLPNGIDVSAEAGYVSDETFLEEWFPSLAEERKPFETSLYLSRRDGQNQLTALVKTDVNDFLAQTPTLESTGYTVDRLPEVGYRAIGTPLFDGRVTWFSENTASVLLPRFGDDTPADRGFSNAQSLNSFGFANTTSFEQAADATGFPTDTVLRADSRQEFSVAFELGALDVTPFVVGRVTAYDDGFEAFNGSDDQVRLWGQAGTRLSTELYRSFNGVQSPTFDLDGIRHVLEPNATIAWAESSLNEDEPLPVFDEDVESLTQGGTFKLGLNQTFQTRRGGPGRQRTVDWVRLNSAVVLQTEDGQDNERVGRFYDYRPEYSRGGDFAFTEALWQISDSVGAVGEITYDFEDNEVAQWRVGGVLQQGRRLRTVLSYEELEPLDSSLINWGLTYELTTKYRLAANQTLDLSGNERRRLDLALERRLPRWSFRVTASWDQLDDEQSVGFVLIPQGWGGGGGFGSGLFD
ncbi:MAG: LPS assembly protein LptD [Planctomycetota bacterium]